MAEVARYLGGYARDLRADGPERTCWPIHAERMQTLIGTLIWIPWDYTVDGPAEFMALLRDTAARINHAVKVPGT